MLWNCLEEDVYLYRPNARWGGEFERLKTLQGPLLEIIAENGLVSGSENLKNCQTAPISPHVVWEGFKKNTPSSSKKNSSIFSYQTRLELQTGLASLVKLNDETKKNCFLAANTQDRDKKYPMCTILLYFWFCGPIFLLEVLDILFSHMVSWILSNTNR